MARAARRANQISTGIWVVLDEEDNRICREDKTYAGCVSWLRNRYDAQISRYQDGHYVGKTSFGVTYLIMRRSWAIKKGLLKPKSEPQYNS